MNMILKNVHQTLKVRTLCFQTWSNQTKTHCLTYSFTKSFLCLEKSNSVKHCITNFNYIQHIKYQFQPAQLTKPVYYQSPNWQLHNSKANPDPKNSPQINKAKIFHKIHSTANFKNTKRPTSQTARDTKKLKNQKHPSKNHQINKHYIPN